MEQPNVTPKLTPQTPGEHPIVNLGTEIAAGVGRRIGEGFAAMAKAMRGLAPCDCPAGMKYHALNCPAHPGEER